MTNETRQMLRALIASREEFAWNNLKENSEYLEVCKEQDKSEKVVEELYQRFDKEDRITICRHYEGEIHKQNFEIKELYIQGLRDGFQLLTFLSGSHSEVQL